ncbi:MAG: ATP synthase F1 subunit delta [Oscillospiraceae bacterium]|nr:ATP synthase F1 subunit delta [Oscillospiraceae bacterium]
MSEIAKLYGGALYDLAAEEGLEAELLAQQETLLELMAAEPDWLRLLAIPSIPKPERTALLGEALAGAHPYLINFAKILCEREAIGEWPACCKEYRRRYNAAHGIVTATATAALPLTGDQKARLEAKLSAMTGKQVQVAVKVDPDCLGGIRLDLDGVQLDGTLKSRLAAVRQAVAQAAL